MTDSATADRPDVTEMAAIHRVFRNAFTNAPTLVGGVADGDTARADVVAAYYSVILKFLSAHHTGEDDLLFPRLAERAPDPALITRVGGQHHDIEGPAAEANAALDAWSASGSSADGERVLAALGAVEGAVVPHLDDEEALVLPVVAEVITQAEWGELAGHPAMRTIGADVWFVLGLVHAEFDDDQKARMEAAMPPQQLAAWNAVGLAAYQQRITELTGA